MNLLEADLKVAFHFTHEQFIDDLQSQNQHFPLIDIA